MSNKMITTNPVKMWIDGKIFPIQKLSKISKVFEKMEKEKDLASDLEQDRPEENVTEEHLRLLDITNDSGKFTTSIKVPSSYYLKMKHLPEFNIEKVSKHTETNILFPKLGQEDAITVESSNTVNLVKAVSHIHSAIGEIRNRNIALQFTCIPCSHPNIIERFENLKMEILSMEQEIQGLHDSIFISPLKLHITIDVYSLLDDREKAEAINALNDYKSTLQNLLEKTGPLKLDIGTLDCMNNNLKKVDVLYANVKLHNKTDEHNLQKIVNDISEHFYHRGLAKRYQENVKLHMTLINTKYRKHPDSPRRKRRRQSLNATKILEKFKDYSFGHCDFDSVHLSHISLKGEDGFYKPLAVIKLNQNKE